MRNLSKEEASAYGQRGQRRRDGLYRWCIEGETLTVPEIAERLGITRAYASRKLTDSRRLPDRLTWALLGLANA